MEQEWAWTRMMRHHEHPKGMTYTFMWSINERTMCTKHMGEEAARDDRGSPGWSSPIESHCRKNHGMVEPASGWIESRDRTVIEERERAIEHGYVARGDRGSPSWSKEARDDRSIPRWSKDEYQVHHGSRQVKMDYWRQDNQPGLPARALIPSSHRDQPDESKGPGYTLLRCIDEGTMCTKKMGEDAALGLSRSTCGSIGTACARNQPEVRNAKEWDPEVQVDAVLTFPWRNQEDMLKGKVLVIKIGSREALVRSNQSVEAKEEGCGWDATKWDETNSIPTRSCITTRVKGRRPILTKPGAKPVRIQQGKHFCPSTVHPGRNVAEVVQEWLGRFRGTTGLQSVDHMLRRQPKVRRMAQMCQDARYGPRGKRGHPGSKRGNLPKRKEVLHQSLTPQNRRF